MNAIVFEVRSRSGDECLFQAGINIKRILDEAGATTSIHSNTDDRLKSYMQKHDRHVITDGGLLGLDVEVSITSNFKEDEAGLQKRFAEMVLMHFPEKVPDDEALINQGFRSFAFIREYDNGSSISGQSYSNRDILYMERLEESVPEPAIGKMLHSQIKSTGRKIVDFGSGEGDSGRGRDHTLWVMLDDDSKIVLILSHR